MSEIIRIGDRIRISVALIKQIYAMPDHASESVELVEVLALDDGCKELMLKRVEPPKPGFHCEVCGHTHTGQQLGYICIGCPCEARAKAAA